MNNEQLNILLYEKMVSEQEAYRDWLLTQPPEEILEHTYEYTVRKDILMALENNDLTNEQAEALLHVRSPLGDVLQSFSKIETDYMETLLNCITERADSLIRQEQDKKQALFRLPVYPYPASYARENGELDAYRTSRNANIACRDAIENAISEHYQNNVLGRDAVTQVVEQFGYDRTLYVLANTLRLKEQDGRISRANKEWAQTIPIFQDDAPDFRNPGLAYAVQQAHPGLLDLFVTQARRDYLLTQPLTPHEIEQEAIRLLRELQAPTPLVSPNGTHFMVQLSPDFLARASTKDQDALLKLLPYQSLALTHINDPKGTFALISKEEQRYQALPKPSVRKKLEHKSSIAKPAPVKKRGMER